MKFDNYDEVKKVIDEILTEKCKFNASIDVDMTVSINSRTVQRAKKQLSFSVMYPHVAWNPKNT